ncbi:nitroreductase/quinone reductase family protein [Actinoplanes sp. NPDC051513]|uniref:nitroreductase/quinone reductase family protein n=1 Tax=Actinoplanes sp. NPDC051513 TaxID=3363908 RepID=UPI0037B05D87
MANDQLPKTLRFQGVANRIVRVLLRTPLIARGVGARLITLYVVGRKSGKRYTVPVAYTAHEGALLIGTPFAWARNLRTGDTVEVRHKGRRRQAGVEALTDEASVMWGYGVIARDNHSFAGFNNIALDAGGNPDEADLRRSWEVGGRVIRLTLR